MTVGRSTSPTHQLGAKAEDAALAFLQQQQFVLIAQNFNTAYGELDLIVRRQSLLVFVEVRLRKAKALVSAAESVTRAKQQKITRSAMIFLQQYPQYQNYECRFDVMALTSLKLTLPNVAQPTYHVDWIEAAFEAQADY